MPEEQRVKKINVPTNYRIASKILRQVVEERKNVKTLVLGNTHLRAGKGLAMMDLILNNMKQIEDIIKRTEIIKNEPKLNPWLCKVLVAELIFGRKDLSGNSLPVECVLSYKEKLEEALSNSDVKPSEQNEIKVPRYVRINLNALTHAGAQRLLQDEGWILVEDKFETYDAFLERVKNLDSSEYLVDFHFKDVLVFPNSAKNYWARNVELKSKFVLQNKACVLPTYLLNPQKKSVVLDMCAAPGLKTTHLANLMKNKGRIYAVERDAERYKTLCEYSSDFGVIKTIKEDCLKLTDEQVPGVEYILLDPSCSGSGMIERLQYKEEVDKQRLYRLGGLQYKLLYHAMTTFPNVKRIVYSTCSIYPEENEEIVLGALKHCGHFKLLNAKDLLELEWKNFGSSEYKGIGEKCLYARPESDLTIGMFVAVFERCEEEEFNEFYLQNEKQKESYSNLNRMVNRENAKSKRRKEKAENGDEPVEKTVKMVATVELDTAEEEDAGEIKKKKKNKKDKDSEPAVILESYAETIENEETSKKKKKKKKSSKDESVNEIQGNNIENNEVGEDTVSPQQSDEVSKKKNKKKAVEKSTFVSENTSLVESETADVVEGKMIKKRKKNKEVVE